MESLPEELIQEILLCLPPKSLVRFRGFLLLMYNFGHHFVLWNPSTRVVKHIPRNLLWFREFVYGFGYDAATDDYLMVLPIVSDEYIDGILVEVFSVRTNSWNQLNCDFPYFKFIDSPNSSEAGSLLDGALHWLALRLGRATIVAFHLTERNFRQVPIPDDFSNRPCDLKLKVLGGFLSLIIENDDFQNEIWVMREYGVKSSWTRSITLFLSGTYGTSVSPICYTKDGQIVVLYGAGLVKFNHKGQVIEACIPNPKLYGTADASVYTESLFSLPGHHGEIHTSESSNEGK
ncbi:F-box/kelch-repeat protein [Senna tora]|uniref:F-box/kelch-repeat protein n=1 Tax=Senna tora TaxID=362788 RepID=A0A834T1U3_9FABA|nr:F-box/kelch-repeat protein [Senna tora]